VTQGPYTRRSARAATFHTLVLRVPAQIASLLGYVLLVRLLPESEFGVYSLFYAVVPVVGTLLSFGMEDTFRRYQPEYLRKGENRLAYLLAQRIGWLRLITTLVFGVVAFVFWDLMGPLFKIAEYRAQFLLFIVLMIGHFQCQLLSMALSGHLLQKHSVGWMAAFSLTKVVGYAVTASVWSLDLQAAIVVDVVAYCVFYAGLKYAYLRKADHERGTTRSCSDEERKRLTRYAAYYSFNDAGTLTLDARKDSFLLAAFLDTISVGAYAFAIRFNDMVGRLSPTTQLDSVIQPLFVSLEPRRDRERVHRYFSFLFDASLLSRVPIVAFTGIYHREIVEVAFAGRFLEYSYLLPLVALFTIATAVSTPITLVAQLQEKPQVILASKVFGVLGIGASAVLIPLAGVVGAVIASGMAIVLKNLFIWWFVRDLARWTDAARFSWRSVLVWTGFTGLALPHQAWLADRPVTMLLTGLVLWAAFSLLQVRVAVTAEHRAVVGGMFTGRERRVLQWLGLA
jgi:O-antigen/teichoic acid export membrane protein